MLLDANKLNIINKSVLYDFTDPEQFPLEATGLIFRGIGQKELEFIRKQGYIASKGKGNDGEQVDKVTCFSQLFSQAEGYARSNYDLYDEPQAYVLAVEPPVGAMENELGEIEVVGKVPESHIKAIIPINQLQKSITRAEAKKVHKELPPGGQWRTVRGHHIYVLDGKVLAGSLEGTKGAKKATKAQLKEHQEHVDKEAKKKAPAKKTTKAAAKPKASEAKKPAPKKKAASEPSAKKADAYLKNRTKAELIDKIREYSRHIKDNMKDKEGFIKYLNNVTGSGSEHSINFINNRATASDNALKQLPRDELQKQAESMQTYYNHFLDHQAKNTKAGTGGIITKKQLAEKAAAKKEPVKKEPVKKTTKAAAKPKAKVKTSEDKKPTSSKKSKLQKKEEPAKKPVKKTTKKKEVAVIRTEKQANNDVAYDVGKKIGGARKDTATKRQIDSFVEGATGQKLADLERTSPELAQKYCVKKNLVSPVDFEAEHKAGTDINVAMAKQLIYDRIQPKPSGDTPKDREQYLNAIKSLQRVLEPIRSWDEFKEATRNLGDHMKAEAPSYLQEQHKYLDYAKREAAREPNDYELKRQYNFKSKEYEDITADQWKAKKAARVKEVEAAIAKHFEKAKKPFAPLGEKLTGFFTDYEKRNRTIDTIAKKKLDWNNYFKEEQKASEAPKEPKGAKNKRKWERVMPAKVQRSGGRTSKVEKPEDMIKNFGFSGVEFGNWVDDASGNFHMKKCAEAFMDLADIVGVKDKDVSFNGKLSMAFGARGKGAALAHYEPGTKAINITKEGGAGSLAHEWGHALDNMMYQQSAGYSSMSFGSNGLQDKGSPEVKAAYKEVMDAIKNGDGKDYVDNKNKTYYRYYPTFKKAVEEFGIEQAIKTGTKIINERSDRAIKHYDGMRVHYGDATIDKKIASEERKRKMAINDMVQEMAYHHEKHTGEKLEQIPIFTGQSQYYIDSSKQGKTDYWTSNEELFARAFENYIEGKMKAGKVKNDYLVAGTYEGTGIPGLPAPYPQGKEREAIHTKFDKLMEAIRSSKAIQKALEIEELEKSFENYNRNAYNVPDTSEVFFIPVNRLKCAYQTEAALNFDKIRENVDRMKAGENLEPVVIGYNYDVHDGHHRIEASKIMNYTHVPCVVGGSNDLDIQRAKEAYAEVWKSLI